MIRGCTFIYADNRHVFLACLSKFFDLRGALMHHHANEPPHGHGLGLPTKSGPAVVAASNHLPAPKSHASRELGSVEVRSSLLFSYACS